MNRLIYDASVEYENIVENLPKNPLTLKLERRTIENVTGRKWFFGTITRYQGGNSEIEIRGFKKMTLTSSNNRFKDNHFINEILFDRKDGTVKLTTCFGLELIIEVEEDFSIALVDLGESDFGKGISFGNHGFTKEEWNQYLNQA
ncbi:hypothetical protein O3Q51_14590 [Cryomorphaceae bacterium 1068]|nr:hypothetical protein [Cryomorphaceae bacterium 1068]